MQLGRGRISLKKKGEKGKSNPNVEFLETRGVGEIEARNLTKKKIGRKRKSGPFEVLPTKGGQKGKGRKKFVEKE